MKYTITKIDEKKGHVTFKMEDGVEQTVCDCPVDSPESIENFMVNYAQNYTTPVVESVVIPKEVKAVIGKEVDVDAILVEREEERIANLPVEVVEVPVEIVPEVVETPVEEVKVETPIEETPAPVVAETTEVVEK